AQDFVLIDNETFPTGDPKIYGLVNRLQKGLPWYVKTMSFLRLMFLHPHVFSRIRAFTSKKPASPLDSTYFSTTPYRLGARDGKDSRHVKYVAEPCDPSGAPGGVGSEDGLTTALAAALAKGAVKFRFGVDVQTDAKRQPIEDPSKCWSKVAGARREWLAEIEIAPQEVEGGAVLAENLSFSPWHALCEHEPIGYINRARRPVYRAMARFRHGVNGIVPVESSEVPGTYRGDPSPVFVPLYRHLYWGPPVQRHDLLSRIFKWILKILYQFLKANPWIMRLIHKVPRLAKIANRVAINRIASRTVQRPLPLTLWTADATPLGADDPRTIGATVSWSALTDRSFTGRHLPPMDEADVVVLPGEDAVTDLFRRAQSSAGEVVKESSNTSALFGFFAQWLSDSFLRTSPDDRRRNTSNHELDLCQIYGLGQASTSMLRAHVGGRLRSRRETPHGELPPFLADPVSLDVIEDFAGICFDPIIAASFDLKAPYHALAGDLRNRLTKSIGPWSVTPERWRLHYAGGLERANSTLLYSAFNTLFLREHNRLAGLLSERYRTTDDHWLFETARNINIVKYLKVLVEEYINHLGGQTFKLRLEQGYADECKWYRANRISLEFNLLYRWHSLIPDRFQVGGEWLKHEAFRFNNKLIEDHGIEKILDAASSQRSGLLELHNTANFLIPVETASIRFSRQFRLAPFNDYRRRWDLKPYASFRELTGDDALAGELEALYPDRDDVRGVDRLELPVGLFAEQRGPSDVLPTLLGVMVASDAFSHALTNPLLAAYVFGKDSLTELGLEEFDRELTLQEIVNDNLAPGVGRPRVSFALPGTP
ncbi:MAG: peroxidase family protein, partial [Allosphingosinicella sp.]